MSIFVGGAGGESGELSAHSFWYFLGEIRYIDENRFICLRVVVR